MSDFKKASEFGFKSEEINKEKWNNNLDVFREKNDEERAEYLQNAKKQQLDLFQNEIKAVKGELEKLANRVDQLKEEASHIENNANEIRDKTTSQEVEIENVNKKIEVLVDENKKMKGEEVALKEAKTQLTDSRNKDLKACCDKKKNFDKVKKLVSGKFQNDPVVQGIMDNIFKFCYGPDARYDPGQRIMASIDDFNTGVRGATCSLNKDFVKDLMDKKIKGGDDSG